MAKYLLYTKFCTYTLPALLPAMLFVAGCQPKTSPAADATIWQESRLENYTTHVYPKALGHIQSGDLITRMGSDITSEMFRQMNQLDKSFSHCGIASIENDTVFVYHALGGEFNPTQAMLRQPLWEFGHASENKALGIFRPELPGRAKTTMLEKLRQLYAARLPFDMQFDYATDAQQYCAELVAKALCRAAADSSWLQLKQVGNKFYVPVDGLYSNPLVSEIQRFSY